MEIRGVDLVSYRVTDLDRSISFYRDTLGLELTYVSDSGHWAEFSVPPTTLGLWKMEKTPWDGVGEIPPFQPAGGGVFLAVDDIKSAIKELEAKGVGFSLGLIEATGCWGAAIHDPDGNQVVLHQRKDGTFG